MQQLEERNTYTPIIPHVRGNFETPIISKYLNGVSNFETPIISKYLNGVSNFETPIISKYLNGVSNFDLALNREETLSVPDLKISSNNSDAALTATGYAGQNLRVSVTVIRATESGTRLPIRYSATENISGRSTAPPHSQECGFRYLCTPRVIMNKKIPDIHQKRPALMKNVIKKDTEPIESWMIEEYYIPFQAS